MQTPGIEADILQRPKITGKGVVSHLPHADLSVDCELLLSSESVFMAIAIAWFVISLIWFLLNSHFYKTQTTLLQRLLMVIPILKLIDTFAYYLFLKQ
jgi:hypothetical protein